MEMTEGEIARKYRMAKHKDKQVGILADINGTSREDIVCILIRAGEAVKPERRKKSRKSKKEIEVKPGHKDGSSAAQPKPPSGEGVSSTTISGLDRCMEELFRKLDTLDEEIARLEKEYRETTAKIHEFCSAKKEI